ncbi:MAG: hypothetical protein EXR77_00295 [Myxococcales bacterium]|nr:hypothetical protein [Myxococcales bacterium]
MVRARLNRDWPAVSYTVEFGLLIIVAVDWSTGAMQHRREYGKNTCGEPSACAFCLRKIVGSPQD